MSLRAHLRGSAVGLTVGVLASYPLATTLGSPVLAVALVMACGAVYVPVGPRAARLADALDSAFTAAALGVPLWGAVSVYLLPRLVGREPQWTAEGMRVLFPALLGWLLSGFLLGAFTPLARRLTGRWLRPVPVMAPAAPSEARKQILILGGGFAGVGTASELERLFRADPAVEFTLVSETNALLFTPMLTEVAASSLEPTHISSPLRTSLRRTRVVRGRAVGFDLERRRVRIQRHEPERGLEGDGDELAYDHLVLALGAVSNYLGNDAVREHSLDFKSLGDAIRVRNAVIAAFDAADAELDPAKRRARLTFVIAGGGFSGAELAGALNDFTRGMLADYPNLSADDLRVVVVHSRERILPELSESLANYALERMQARGVTFRLNARVTDAAPGIVTVQTKGRDGSPPEEITADTLVWTAGSAPSPVLKTLPVEHDRRGAVVTGPTLAVKGWPGVWALGDCASVPDAKTGQPCPGTAQFAVRQAPHLARNLHAVLHGREPKGFHFDALGTLCVVGHQTACAEIRGYRFSGFFAWLLWRGIYWAKLPGLERKVRVLGDWLIELFFPRDIVQTLDFGDERGGSGVPRPTPQPKDPPRAEPLPHTA